MTELSPELSPVEKFLDITNFVVRDRDVYFDEDSPISRILKRGILDPETFVGIISSALGVEFDEVRQDLIVPETDTVATMFERLTSA